MFVEITVIIYLTYKLADMCTSASLYTHTHTHRIIKRIMHAFTHSLKRDKATKHKNTEQFSHLFIGVCALWHQWPTRVVLAWKKWDAVCLELRLLSTVLAEVWQALSVSRRPQVCVGRGNPAPPTCAVRVSCTVTWNAVGMCSWSSPRTALSLVLSCWNGHNQYVVLQPILETLDFF